MRIRRAAKYGFCAGVRIADKKVKKFAAEEMLRLAETRPEPKRGTEPGKGREKAR